MELYCASFHLFLSFEYYQRGRISPWRERQGVRPRGCEVVLHWASLNFLPFESNRSGRVSPAREIQGVESERSAAGER